MASTKKKSRWLWPLLVVALIIVSSVASFVFSGNTREHSKGERIKSQHQSLPTRSSDTVFFGDDLIAEGLWSELFPMQSVRNRGVSGEQIADTLRRAGGLVEKRPRKIILHVGANDLAQRRTQTQMLADYRELINFIRALSPATQIVATSIIPGNYSELEKSQSFNTALARLAEDLDIDYVDILDAMLDENQRISEDMVDAQLHLRGEGYRLWRDKLQIYMP